MPTSFLRRHIPDPTLRRLAVQSIVIVLLCVLVGIVVQAVTGRNGTPMGRAESLARSGKLDQAAEIYWSVLGSDHSRVDALIGLIDCVAVPREDEAVGPFVLTMGDRETSRRVEELLAGPDLPASVRTLGQFWYDVRIGDEETDLAPVLELAEREPPVAWSNHLLALKASLNSNGAEAARRFEREGLHNPQLREDIDAALFYWLRKENWQELRRRVSDPDYPARIDPQVRFRVAVHERDLVRAAAWLWPATYLDRGEPPTVLLASVSACLWFLFCAILGRMTEKPARRVPLYLAAFALGALSIYPTHVAITIQDGLGLRPNGNPGIDLAFYVFGVGLREELAKLLLFLPLLPTLKKSGTRQEAITCGALVGLGFAAIENISYFELGLGVALTRFLTANFLHMSMTAILSVSLWALVTNQRDKPDNYSQTLAIIVSVHGGYDFLLSSPLFAEVSWLSMTTLVLVSRQFLNMAGISRHGNQDRRLLSIFVLAVATVCGASFIYASLKVGPMAAAGLMATGLLGSAILIYMFVQELGRV